MLGYLFGYSPLNAYQTPSLRQTSGAISNQDVSNNGQVTITFGSNPVTGSLLIVVIGWVATAGATTISQYTGTTGWTQYYSGLVSTQYQGAVFYKVSTGSGDVSATFLSSSNTNKMWPVAMEITGCDPNLGTVINQFSYASVPIGTTTVTTTALTPGLLNCLPIAVYGAGAQTATIASPSNWTIDQSVGGSALKNTYLANAINLTADTSTPISVTWTPSATTTTNGFVVNFMIAPPPGHTQSFTASMGSSGSFTATHIHNPSAFTASIAPAGSFSKQTQLQVGVTADNVSVVQSPSVNANISAGGTITLNSSNGGMVATTPGNVLIAWVTSSNAGAGQNVTPPSGWNLLTSTSSGVANFIACYYTQPSTSITSAPFTLSVGGYASVVMCELSGVNPNNPLAGYVSNENSGGTFLGNMPLVPGQQNNFAIACFGIDAATSATPKSSWTTVAQNVSGNYGFNVNSNTALASLATLQPGITTNTTQPLVGIGVLFNNQTLSAIGPTASLVKQTIRLLPAASLSLSGFLATVREMFFAMTAVLTSAGSFSKKTLRTLIAGFASSASSFITNHQHFLAPLVALLTPSGNFVKQTNLPLSATLPSSGGFSRQVNLVLSAVFGSTGLLSKLVGAALSAGISPVSAFTRQSQMPLSAILSSGGGLVKQVGVALSATLGSSGSLVKSISRTLAAVFSPTATIAKSYVKSLAAALTSSGSLSRQIGNLLTAVLSTSASSFAKQVNYVLAAVLTPASVFGRALTRGFSAVFAPAATIAKQLQRSLSAGLTPSGGFLKQTLAPLFATLGLTGLFVKQANLPFSASLGFIGSWSRSWIHGIVLSASAGFSGAYSKSVGLLLTATLAPTTFITKFTSAVMSAILAPVGTFSKSSPQGVFHAVLSLIGSLTQYKLDLPQYFMVLQMPTPTTIAPPIPTQQLITAGESGILLVVHTGGFLLSQQYNSVNLLIQPQSLPIQPHVSYAMQVTNSGYTAQYTLTGSEFPVGGIYNVQLQVINGNEVYYSPSVNLRVNNQIMP